MLHILFPYIVLLFLIDCLSYAGAGTVCFVSKMTQEFKVRGPGLFISGVFPWGRSIVLRSFPFCLTDEGIHSTPGNEGEAFYSYAKMGPVRAVSRDVLMGSQVLIKAHSPAEAISIADILENLRTSPLESRLLKIERFLTAATDIEAFKKQETTLKKPITIIGFLSAAIFVLVFVLLPIGLYSSGFPPPVTWGIVVVIGVLHLSVIACTYYWHRALDPNDPESRWTLIACLVLLPPSSIHVLGSLTRHLFVRFDPVTLAAALLPKEQFEEFFKKTIQKVRLGQGHSNSKVAEFWAMKECALQKLAVGAGLSTQKIGPSPIPLDLDANSYCPTCQIEYRPGFNVCADCDEPLLAYKG